MGRLGVWGAVCVLGLVAAGCGDDSSDGGGGDVMTYAQGQACPVNETVACGPCAGGSIGSHMCASGFVAACTCPMGGSGAMGGTGATGGGSGAMMGTGATGGPANNSNCGADGVTMEANTGCGGGLKCTNLGVATTCACPGSNAPPACTANGGECAGYPGTTCMSLGIAMACVQTCTLPNNGTGAMGGSGGMGSGGMGGATCPDGQTCGMFGICAPGGLLPPSCTPGGDACPGGAPCVDGSSFGLPGTYCLQPC